MPVRRIPTASPSAYAFSPLSVRLSWSRLRSHLDVYERYLPGRLIELRTGDQIVEDRLRVVELALPERHLRVGQLQLAAEPLPVLRARDLEAAAGLRYRETLRPRAVERLVGVLHERANLARGDVDRLLPLRHDLAERSPPLIDASILPEAGEDRDAHAETDDARIRALAVAHGEEARRAIVLCADDVVAEEGYVGQVTH